MMIMVIIVMLMIFQGAKAHLPPAQYMAVRAVLDVSRETEMDGGENDRERYVRRMIERIMTQYDDLGVEFESSDLEYLLTKMDELPADVLGDHPQDAATGG